MNITKNENGVFTIDEKEVGTVEQVKQAVVDATVALEAARETLTNAQIVEDAVVNYTEPAPQA